MRIESLGTMTFPFMKQILNNVDHTDISVMTPFGKEFCDILIHAIH